MRSSVHRLSSFQVLLPSCFYHPQKPFSYLKHEYAQSRRLWCWVLRYGDGVERVHGILCSNEPLNPDLTGSYVARELGRNPRNVVYLASRNPSKIHDKLKNEAPFAPGSETASHYPATESGTKSGASSSNGRLGTPLTIDITSSDINKSLVPAFEGAHTIVSLVGILHGSPEAFEKIQLNGNENVFKAAKSVGARVVHVSAVGANVSSEFTLSVQIWNTDMVLKPRLS